MDKTKVEIKVRDTVKKSTIENNNIKIEQLENELFNCRNSCAAKGLLCVYNKDHVCLVCGIRAGGYWW